MDLFVIAILLAVLGAGGWAGSSVYSYLAARVQGPQQIQARAIEIGLGSNALSAGERELKVPAEAA